MDIGFRRERGETALHHSSLSLSYFLTLEAVMIRVYSYILGDVVTVKTSSFFP